MTSRDTRLDKLADNLTARERALLVLRSWKEGREEEGPWRWTMPESQAPEFNHYITLMNGVNERLHPLIVVLGLEVDKLHLRLGILATLTLWNLHALKVDDYLTYGTKRRNGAVLSLQDSLERAPLRPLVYLSEEDKERIGYDDRPPTKLDEVAQGHKDVLREGIADQGALLRAIGTVVGEVADQFGEEALIPRVRELLDEVAQRLADARQQAERYTGPLDETEPDAGLIDKVRALVEDQRP